MVPNLITETKMLTGSLSSIVMICLLRHNFKRENMMKRIVLFMIMLLLSLAPGISFASDPIPLRPNRSEGFTSQRNSSNLTSHPLGVDSQGNTSVLTPNRSGGYIGIDSRGRAVIVTPLRGNLGVDSSGNIWTITSR
jgi:hypothetical protein